MSQKFKQKEIKPDPKYGSVLVAKFINQLMQGGNKATAQHIVYNAFDIIKKQTKKDPQTVLEEALQVAGPKVEVRPMRVGGATYQVPREVKDKRRVSLAIRWIIQTARNKKGASMEERLSKEILAVIKHEGDTIRKKINIEKMAAANRAFAHLAR